MPRYIVVAELNSPGFQPEMTLNGTETDKNLLLDAINGGELNWAKVSKLSSSRKKRKRSKPDDSWKHSREMCS